MQIVKEKYKYIASSKARVKIKTYRKENLYALYSAIKLTVLIHALDKMIGPLKLFMYRA